MIFFCSCKIKREEGGKEGRQAGSKIYHSLTHSYLPTPVLTFWVKGANLCWELTRCCLRNSATPRFFNLKLITILKNRNCFLLSNFQIRNPSLTQGHSVFEVKEATDTANPKVPLPKTLLKNKMKAKLYMYNHIGICRWRAILAIVTPCGYVCLSLVARGAERDPVLGKSPLRAVERWQHEHSLENCERSSFCHFRNNLRWKESVLSFLFFSFLFFLFFSLIPMIIN